MVDEKDGQEKQGGAKEPPTPPVGPVDRNGDSTPSREKRQDETDHPQHNVSEAAIVKLTAALVRWTGVLAVATIGLAGVALLQWNELHNTDVTLRETLLASQRAWIAPMTVKVLGDFEVGKKSKFIVKYKNIGNEPAIRLRHNAIFAFAGAPDPADYCEEAIKNNSPSWTNYPSNSFEYDLHTDGPPDSFIPHINNGIAALELRGCFAYETFSEIHRSRFCFRWIHETGKKINEWGWLFCPAGNEAD